MQDCLCPRARYSIAGCGRWPQIEDRAASGAAKGRFGASSPSACASRAVEAAVRADCHATEWKLTVIASLKAVQAAQNPAGVLVRQLENRTVARGATIVGSPI